MKWECSLVTCATQHATCTASSHPSPPSLPTVIWKCQLYLPVSALAHSRGPFCGFALLRVWRSGIWDLGYRSRQSSMSRGCQNQWMNESVSKKWEQQSRNSKWEIPRRRLPVSWQVDQQYDSSQKQYDESHKQYHMMIKAISYVIWWLKRYHMMIKARGTDMIHHDTRWCKMIHHHTSPPTSYKSYTSSTHDTTPTPPRLMNIMTPLDIDPTQCRAAPIKPM